MNPEDGLAGLHVRLGQFQEQVKPSAADHGRIHQLQPVGRAEDHDAFQGFNAVHLGQKLADHPLGHVPVAAGAPPREEAVNFIEKQNRR